MRKPRTEYAYVAHRIDPADTQNLGDFSIRRQLPTNEYSENWTQTYHYASEDYDGPHDPQGPFRQGRIVNRRRLTNITRGSQIYSECIRAVERLLKEEQGNG